MKEEVMKPVTVHFVLQESSGYMEPMLCILAILHTVISFFCIIGYYCLKVGYMKEWEVNKELNREEYLGLRGDSFEKKKVNFPDVGSIKFTLS